MCKDTTQFVYNVKVMGSVGESGKDPGNEVFIRNELLSVVMPCLLSSAITDLTIDKCLTKVDLSTYSLLIREIRTK